MRAGAWAARRCVGLEPTWSHIHSYACISTHMHTYSSHAQGLHMWGDESTHADAHLASLKAERWKALTLLSKLQQNIEVRRGPPRRQSDGA